MTFIEIKNELDSWCEEYGIDRGDTMHYPFRPEETMTIMQAMWRLHSEGRVNSMRGLRIYFDRYVSARHLQPVA